MLEIGGGCRPAVAQRGSCSLGRADAEAALASDNTGTRGGRPSSSPRVSPTAVDDLHLCGHGSRRGAPVKRRSTVYFKCCIVSFLCLNTMFFKECFKAAVLQLFTKCFYVAMIHMFQCTFWWNDPSRSCFNRTLFEPFTFSCFNRFNRCNIVVKRQSCIN